MQSADHDLLPIFRRVEMYGARSQPSNEGADAMTLANLNQGARLVSDANVFGYPELRVTRNQHNLLLASLARRDDDLSGAAYQSMILHTYLGQNPSRQEVPQGR